MDAIGHYEILGKLGEGGMGVVCRARDTKLGRDVALKVLPAALARDPERMARFEREARAVAALNDPRIGQLYDVGPNYPVMKPVATIAMRFGNRGHSWVSKPEPHDCRIRRVNRGYHF